MEQKLPEIMSSFQDLQITEAQLKESLSLGLFQQISLDFYQGWGSWGDARGISWIVTLQTLD